MRHTDLVDLGLRYSKSHCLFLLNVAAAVLLNNRYKEIKPSTQL